MEPSDLTSWALTTELPILQLHLPAKSLQSSFAIEWCPAKFSQTEMFAVVALDQSFIYGASDEQENEEDEDITSLYVKLCNLPEHNGLIRSVSWAPSMGRLYHLIATGCKDGYVRIFKATEGNNGELSVTVLAKMNDHKLEVWKVSWNTTGTILLSAGDDGKIRLWKCNYLNEWRCMSVINSDNRMAPEPDEK